MTTLIVKDSRGRLTKINICRCVGTTDWYWSFYGEAGCYLIEADFTVDTTVDDVITYIHIKELNSFKYVGKVQ
jgi:hypothetical protein